jgi:virginiamycin A acetyltransferase
MPADQFPAPATRHPLRLPDGTAHRGAVFLRAVIDHPRIEVGDYSYAFDRDPPDDGDWAGRLAPYLYPFSPERLVIGKFVQIAHGVRIVTSSANHRHDGFSSYPFAIFGGGPPAGRPSLPGPGPDTVIGNDVWLGEGAMVLPGARIGHGAIVGAGAVVSGEVGDYCIVAGNPARELRRRVAPEIAARLVEIAWWDWPIARILDHEMAICGADLAALEKAAARGA